MGQLLDEVNALLAKEITNTIALSNDNSGATTDELDRLIDEINSQAVTPPNDSTGALDELMRLTNSTTTEHYNYFPFSPDALIIIIVLGLVLLIVGIRVYFETDLVEHNKTPRKNLSNAPLVEHSDNLIQKHNDGNKSSGFVKFVKKVLYYIFIVILVIVLPPSIKGLAFIVLLIIWISKLLSKNSAVQSSQGVKKTLEKQIHGVQNWYSGLNDHSKKELLQFYNSLQGITGKKNISKMIDTYYEKNLSHIYSSEDKVYKDLYSLKDYL